MSTVKILARFLVRYMNRLLCVYFKNRLIIVPSNLLKCWVHALYLFFFLHFQAQVELEILPEIYSELECHFSNSVFESIKCEFIVLKIWTVNEKMPKYLFFATHTSEFCIFISSSNLFL